MHGTVFDKTWRSHAFPTRDDGTAPPRMEIGAALEAADR